MHGKRTLQQKAFLMMLAVSVTLLFVINGIFFVINILGTMKNYKKETANEMRYAVSVLGADYLDNAFAKVRERYNSIPEEIKSDPFSDEYIMLLADLVDEDFWNARDVLVKFRENTGLDSISIIMTDAEKGRVIFVVDGYDLEGAYLPGQWLSEEITPIDTIDEIQKIVNSDITMYLAYGKVTGWIATNYVEIHGSDGQLLGYAAGDINITGFVKNMLLWLLLHFFLSMVAIVLSAWYISGAMMQRMINPINSLSAAAQEYTKRDKAVLNNETTEEKSFFDNLDITRTGDEIETLWTSLSEMEKDINETMLRIRKLSSEKERALAEMSVASSIQEGMLIKDFPAFPARGEFDIYAFMRPAKEVGGDLYDFFLIDDDHLCLVIGDVSGKGVPAALFMAVATTIIRNVAKTGNSISDMMKELNSQLCRNNQESLFVTLWLGIYTISTRHLISINAGHEYPAIYRNASGKYELYVSSHCIPLGIMEDADYVPEEIEFSEGDKLFIYTDGVKEATRADDVLYGTGRMLECLNSSSDRKCKEMLDAVSESVEMFTDGADQFDDLTMLIFEIKK